MDQEKFSYIDHVGMGYMISNMGRVISIHIPGVNKNKSVQLKTAITKFGYELIRLPVYGDVKNFKVHRLVAQSFLPNPDKKRTVNHKDGNKLNNCLSNLEWNTHKENIRHAIDNGSFADGVRHSRATLTRNEVLEIRILKSAGVSIKRMMKLYNKPRYIISLCASNKTFNNVK